MTEENLYKNKIKLKTIEVIKIIPNIRIKILKINIEKINKAINNIKESIVY